jgi:hypothetical protein
VAIALDEAVASDHRPLLAVLEWQAMGWKQPIVHDLCTDRETATRLLEAKRNLPRRWGNLARRKNRGNDPGAHA